MSLAGRLTAFFLIALAFVLAGFSLALYLLADAYLNRQADERLEASLGTLAAAAEVKPEGVEWEPQERVLNLGQVHWTVHDDRGRLIHHSPHQEVETLSNGSMPEASAGESVGFEAERSGQPWRLRQMRLQPSQSPLPQGNQNNQHHEGNQRGSHRDEDPQHAGLVLTAGVSLQPLQSTLRTLAAALTGLSVGLWLLAALVSRKLCRGALVPLTRMAATARTMSAVNLEQRLPTPGTGDELEELSLAFNDLLTRLQEAFERQQRFAGSASHQLRTPLAAVLGQIEVSLTRDRPATEYRQTLQLVHRQALRLRQIVESLLFLARADAEAMLPDLEAVDLSAWVPEYLQGWSEHARRADLQIEYPSSPLWVRVHLPLFGQLLDNLLDNACKYSEPGTPITLRFIHEPGWVALAVEDAGCGIAPADLPHIFQPFYRSTQVRLRGRNGVGLGLAVAERIVGAFKGTIRAESKIGQGSRFVVQLPELLCAPAAVPYQPGLVSSAGIIDPLRECFALEHFRKLS